ncbi:MAG: hypothetical protein ACLFUJ_01850 [Phycisphaerae bacterium]
MRCSKCKSPLDADDPQAVVNGLCPHCGPQSSNRAIESLAMHVQAAGEATRHADVIPFETPRKRKLRALIILAVCSAGIVATVIAKNIGRSLPKVVQATQQAEATGQARPAAQPAPAARVPAQAPAPATAVTLRSFQDLEYRALLAEQRRDLPAALDSYSQLLQLAGEDPSAAAGARELLQRARRQRDLLIAWQMLIKSGQPDAAKPTSLDSIFDR